MESIQNAERRRDVVNDSPRRMTIEVPLIENSHISVRCSALLLAPQVVVRDRKR